MLGRCARPLGRDEGDQTAGGLGGARIGLVDLNRHADVAADRCVGWAGRPRVGWVRASEDSDAAHEDLPEHTAPWAYSNSVAWRRHEMATAACRGDGERDSTRSRSS